MTALRHHRSSNQGTAWPPAYNVPDCQQWRAAQIERNRTAGTLRRFMNWIVT